MVPLLIARTVLRNVNQPVCLSNKTSVLSRAFRQELDQAGILLVKSTAAWLNCLRNNLGSCVLFTPSGSGLAIRPNLLVTALANAFNHQPPGAPPTANLVPLPLTSTPATLNPSSSPASFAVPSSPVPMDVNLSPGSFVENHPLADPQDPQFLLHEENGQPLMELENFPVPQDPPFLDHEPLENGQPLMELENLLDPQDLPFLDPQPLANLQPMMDLPVPGFMQNGPDLNLVNIPIQPAIANPIINALKIYDEQTKAAANFYEKNVNILEQTHQYDQLDIWYPNQK